MFQTKVRQAIREYEKQHKEKPFYESVERWTQYMEEDLVYNNMNEMVNTVIEDVENGGKFSLDKVAKKIGFNHKHRFAVFRDGIFVDSTSAQNRQGGVFQMILLANAGDTQLLGKFNCILCKVFKLLNNVPQEVADGLNGLYLHAEVNPGMLLRGADPYKDKQNLPIMFKLEIWVRNVRDEKLFVRHVISKINTECFSTLNKRQFREFWDFRANADKGHQR